MHSLNQKYLNGKGGSMVISESKAGPRRDPSSSTTFNTLHLANVRDAEAGHSPGHYDPFPA